MQILPLIVLGYFAFQSYLLEVYSYHGLAYHMVWVMGVHLYLVFRRQSCEYDIGKGLTQRSSTQQQNQTQQLPMCKICQKSKPSRYYHCRRCNICIYRMDHHCQWVGSCIGQYNAKPYLHFILNLFLHTVIVLIHIFVFNYAQIVQNDDRSVYLLILILPAIFILFETQRLLRDFYSMVKINQTLIQSYKKVKGKGQPFMVNISQFLGSSSMILWLIPFYSPLENPSQSSNLLETTENVSQQQKQNDNLTYADQYIYGRDDQDEDWRIKQAKQT